MGVVNKYKRTSTTEKTMNLQDAQTYLQENLPKIGLGVAHAKLTNNICHSLVIYWSIEPREEWINGIMQNSLGGIIHIFNNQDSRDHRYKEGYHFDYTNWRSGYKFRRATNKDLKKLCDNILKQLETKYKELAQ